MQFYGALILLVTLSAACALKCYMCAGASCTVQRTCPDVPLNPLDRCATTTVNGTVFKNCVNSGLCVDPTIKCCSTDLCNSAVPTGSSILLLLVSSAIITIFL